MTAWTSIAHVEVGAGGASSISFSSIPQTYSDLYLVVSHRNTGSEGQARITVNGVTGNNFPKRWLTIDNGAASTYTDSSNFPFWTNPSTYTANSFALSSIYFANYRSSTNKTFIIDSVTSTNATNVYSLVGAMLWNGTNAISSIVLEMAAFNFAQYSSATLYGITKGSGGGVVVS